MVEGLLRPSHREDLLKTAVIVRRGPWRGRRDCWIAGDLDRQNPFATRAAVFSGAGVAVLDLANLDRADRQLELALLAQTKTPPAMPAASDAR